MNGLPSCGEKRSGPGVGPLRGGRAEIFPCNVRDAMIDCNRFASVGPIDINGRSTVVALLLLMLPMLSYGQGAIEGTVVDDGTNEALPGVTVAIPDLNMGAVTNADGAFRIDDVPAGTHVVELSMVGYSAESVEVEVEEDETARIELGLRDRMLELDEVVVTGTAGGMQRRALGNTVTSIDASEAVENAPIPDVQSLMQGRAAGAAVMPGSGQIGSGSQIRIRGASSLSLSNDPLVYVDGVRVDGAQATGPAVQGFGSSVISRLNDFAPGDIESIEILKGPAAATLYGTEANNGVINIITQRGQEGAPQFNFTSRIGTNFFRNKESRMFTNYWRNPDTGSVESLNLVRSERERGTPIFEPGLMQNYNLSVRGGADRVQYFLSGNVRNEEGVEPTNEVSRYGARLNLTLNATDNLDVTTNLGYTTGRTDLSREGGTGGVTWGAYFSTPAHLNENLPDDAPRHRGYRSFTSDAYYEWDDFQDLTRITGSAEISWRWTDYFGHRLSLGIDEVREDNQSILENSPIFQEFSPGSEGSKSVSQRNAVSQTIDYSNTLTVDLTSGLTSQTQSGVQYYRSFTESVTASGEDFAVPGLRAVDAAARNEGAENFFEEITLGGFVQHQFNYEDRLFLTTGLRADDNSAFGRDFDFVLYPNVNSAWVISEEDFFDVPQVDNLRLRASYGHTGQQPGFFDAVRSFNPVTGPGDTPAVTPSAVGNPDLGPERGIEWEAGFEGAFLNDRLSAEFTGFTRTTRDAILIRDVSPSTGFGGNQFVNVGEIDNWGIELSLGGTPVQTDNWNLSLNASVATNNSEIADLGADRDVIVESSAFGMEHREGDPIASWYMPELIDVQVSQEEPEGFAHAVSGADAFLHDFVCADGDGGTMSCFDADGSLVAPDVFIGQAYPRFEGAFSATLNFLENFRLHTMVDYQAGHYKWDYTNQVRGLFNITREQHFPDEDPVRAAGSDIFRTFDVHIDDASFARLREVSLRYNVPHGLIDGVGLSQASISVAARNLYTLTGFDGMDPETNFLGGGRGGHTQIAQNELPPLTQVVGTINLRF